MPELIFHTRYFRQSGFTLVELAIALMVIGLLIGGVLKGQELIENARVTRTVKDLNDYDTAIMIFRNTYNALPGDMRNAATRLPNCGAPYCDLTHTYNGDSIINTDDEVRNVWIHMDRAGLISGVNEQEDHYSASPVNALGGHFLIRYLTPLDNGIGTAEHPLLHRYRIGDLSTGGANSDRLKDCTRIRRFDDKMDDGKPFTGRVTLYFFAIQCYDADTLEYTKSKTRTYILVESDTAN